MFMTAEFLRQRRGISVCSVTPLLSYHTHQVLARLLRGKDEEDTNPASDQGETPQVTQLRRRCESGAGMEARGAGVGSPRSRTDEEEREANRQAGHSVARTRPGGTEVWRRHWEGEAQS